MLTLLLTAIVFYLTRQIIRADEQATLVGTIDGTFNDAELEGLTNGIYSEVAALINTLPKDFNLGTEGEDLITISEVPYLDPATVMAIDLSLLLP